MRALLIAVFRVLMRMFYHRVELIDAERVPPAPEPVIFCLNHPNALVDSLFVYCYVPRKAVFLAKAPLFRTPLVGSFVRTLECLPIYRREDGVDPSLNQRTFQEAADCMAAGSTIAIFPEGTSHSEPALQPMKTGAARIALGARRRLDSLHIVPVGLFYTDKQTFRSQALATFGEPIPVPCIEGDGEPPREAVHELTERIGAAITQLTINAESSDLARLAAFAQQVLDSVEEQPASPAVAFERRLQLINGYRTLRDRDPGLVGPILERLRSLEGLIGQTGVDIHRLSESYSVTGVLCATVPRVALAMLMAPVALVGILVHWPAYRFIGRLAERLGQQEPDVKATYKFLGGLLFFPITWTLYVIALGLLGGAQAALAAALLAPFSGWVAMHWNENLLRWWAAGRALWLFLTGRRLHRSLVRERAALIDDLRGLTDQLESTGA